MKRSLETYIRRLLNEELDFTHDREVSFKELLQKLPKAVEEATKQESRFRLLRAGVDEDEVERRVSSSDMLARKQVEKTWKFLIDGGELYAFTPDYCKDCDGDYFESTWTGTTWDV